MVGDGINDAPVSNLLRVNVTMPYHLSVGIDGCRHRYRYRIRKSVLEFMCEYLDHR